MSATKSLLPEEIAHFNAFEAKATQGEVTTEACLANLMTTMCASHVGLQTTAAIAAAAATRTTISQPAVPKPVVTLAAPIAAVTLDLATLMSQLTSSLTNDKIPSFSGAKDSMPAEWISKFEIHAEMNGWRGSTATMSRHFKKHMTMAMPRHGVWN